MDFVLVVLFWVLVFWWILRSPDGAGEDKCGYTGTYGGGGW